MEAMTLEHVRDRLRTDSAYWEKKGGARTVQARLLRTYADAIDAHLAQPAQAVAVVLNRALDAAAFLNGIGRHDHAQPLRDAVHAICPESAKSMDLRALSVQKAGPVGGCAVNERCQKVMRDRGKPYPRTCYVCGLWGPCVTSDAQLASLPASPTPDKEGQP